jgi:[acyl-carrier-protein] S-malonyltransferase
MAQKEAFVFPGQGSQKVGMGEKLLEQSEIARNTLDEAQTVLSKLGWRQNLLELCLKGPIEALNQTETAQPVLLAISTAAFRHRVRVAQTPSLVAGHSLGEYSALTAAGVFTFEQAVELVAERGRLMKEAGDKRPGKMAAVIGLGVETVETLCVTLSTKFGGAHVTIANINSPGQIVISGDQEAIEKATEFAKELGAKMTVVLPVSIAAHSDLMKSAQEGMAIALRSTTIKKPIINFISTITGEYENDPQTIRTLLVSQLTGRVLWLDTVKQMVGDGYDSFLEVGPGEVLTKLVKRIDGSVNANSLNL